jgi:hypothetical protein
VTSVARVLNHGVASDILTHINFNACPGPLDLFDALFADLSR